jgi:hypothetical protein
MTMEFASKYQAWNAARLLLDFPVDPGANGDKFMRTISALRMAVAALVVAGSAFIVRPASATSIVWTLHDLEFNDDGTGSGTFTVDSVTGQITTWDITTTAGTVGTGTHYENGVASGFAVLQSTFLGNDTAVFAASVSPDGFVLVLTFLQSQLTSPYAVNYILPNLQYSFERESTNGGSTTIYSRAYTDVDSSNTSLSLAYGSAPVVTPLPPALPLFATGLGALGLLGWRTKRKAHTIAA